MPILEAKYRLGLFEHPYVDESKVEAQLTSPAGLALERKLAARSMVLLKNDNHTLPLTRNLKKVAVIGSLADSTKDIEGGWTVEGLFGDASKSHPVTVLAGLKEQTGAECAGHLRSRCDADTGIPLDDRYLPWAKIPPPAYSGRSSRLDCEGQSRGEGFQIW